MNIKLELLRDGISDLINQKIDQLEIDVSKVADSMAKQLRQYPNSPKSSKIAVFQRCRS